MIFYENLILSFNKEIKKIEKILSIKPKNRIIKPTIKDKGVFNRLGIIGDYQNYFSTED